MNNMVDKTNYYFKFDKSRRIGLNPEQVAKLLEISKQKLYSLDMRKCPNSCIEEVQFKDVLRFTKCCGTFAEYDIIAFPEKFAEFNLHKSTVDCDAKNIEECWLKFRRDRECKCSIVNDIIGPIVLPGLYKGK